MGNADFRLTFALKVTNPLRHRHISGYNVSTVRDSEKSSIMTNTNYEVDHDLSNEQ